MSISMNRTSAADWDIFAYLRGRTAWEGFWTATRAAAAGGVTTLVGIAYLLSVC